MLLPLHRPIRRVIKAALAFATLLGATAVHAVPSYARQTGQDCAACHVGAYGPHLTAYGARFKLGGYVDSDGKADKVPLSAMLVAGTSRYRDDDGNRTSKTALAEASVFVAGKLTEHLGSFVQITHDGIEHSTSIDQMDIRYARETRVGERDLLLGISLNNNPTVQDPLNTLSVWGFPFVSSPFGNSIGADFMGLGTAEHKVLGLTGYTVLDNRVMAELGLYNTLSPAFQSRLGLSRDEAEAFGRLRNAPYWRLAYMRDLRTSAWSAGVFGFNGRLTDRASGDLIGRFRDIGIDASWQFLGTRRHVFTVDASHIREHEEMPNANDPAALDRNTVKDSRLSASYHYANTYGVTVGMFNATSTDGQSGNRGTLLQADWTPWGKESSWGAPWANLRIGIQFVAYGRYIDGGTAADKPSDRNTTYLFAWTAL